MTLPPVGVAVVILGAAYLIGSVPVAWMLGRRRNIELRAVGSGNPGTSNLFRHAGVAAAALSGPLQFAQGLVPVLIARALHADGTVIDLAAVCAVLGNGWPVWLGFNGQRCIAVATGAVAAMNPVLLVVLLVCFGAGALAHAIALGVLAGFTLLPVAAASMGRPGLTIACATILVVILTRRLAGAGHELRTAPSRSRRRILLRRLLLDERPGQVLVGPREGPAPATTWGA